MEGGGEAKSGGQQMDIIRFSRQYNHKYITEKESIFSFFGKNYCFKGSVRMMFT